MDADGNAVGGEREFALLQRKKSGVGVLRGVVGGGALPAARSGGPARTTAEEIPAELESFRGPGKRGTRGVRGFGEIWRAGETLRARCELARGRGAARTNKFYRGPSGSNAGTGGGSGTAR